MCITPYMVYISRTRWEVRRLSPPKNSASGLLILSVPITLSPWCLPTGTGSKSVLDAGWSQLRSQLRYKAIRHGGEYIEVDERFSTQVCSACGARGGPQGREGLVVREWSCGGCGARHDRDINSAINLLVSGRNVGLRQTEIPSLGGEDVNRASLRCAGR